MTPSPLLRARTQASWFVAGVGLLVFLSFWTLDLQWAKFLAPDALRKMARFLGELFPPNLEPAFLARLLPAALETLAMSALGTLIAALLGLVLALPASKTHAYDPARWRALTRLALNGAIFTAWGETLDEPARKQREQLLRGFAKHLPNYCNVRMREWDTDSAKYGDIHCSIAALKRQPPQEYQSLVNTVAGIAGLQCDPFTIAGVTLVHHRMRTLAFPQQGSWYFPFGVHATMPAESDVLGLDTTLSTGNAKP